MKKLIVSLAILFSMSIMCFSQVNTSKTEKYALASFHYFIPGTGAIWACSEATNLGGSIKYGLRIPFAGTSLFFDTGAGLGVMSYKGNYISGSNYVSEIYPYVFVPVSIGYRLGASNSLSLSPHVGVAGVIGLKNFKKFSIGGWAPTLGFTVQAKKLLIDLSYNLFWVTNSCQLGDGNFSLGIGWVF